MTPKLKGLLIKYNEGFILIENNFKALVIS